MPRKKTFNRPGRPEGPTARLERAHRSALWYIKRHYSPEFIAKICGIHDNTVRKWYTQYWSERNDTRPVLPGAPQRERRAIEHTLSCLKRLSAKAREIVLQHFSQERGVA